MFHNQKDTNLFILISIILMFWGSMLINAYSGNQDLAYLSSLPYIFIGGMVMKKFEHFYNDIHDLGRNWEVLLLGMATVLSQFVFMHLMFTSSTLLWGMPVSEFIWAQMGVVGIVLGLYYLFCLQRKEWKDNKSNVIHILEVSSPSIQDHETHMDIRENRDTMLMIGSVPDDKELFIMASNDVKLRIVSNCTYFARATGPNPSVRFIEPLKTLNMKEKE